MTKKITFTKTETIKKRIELGNEGDPVFIEPITGSSGRFVFITSVSNNKYIEFDGTSYQINIINFCGDKFPSISEVYNRHGRATHFSLSRVKNIVSGKEEIIKYLKAKNEPEYDMLAGLIKKLD